MSIDEVIKQMDDTVFPFTEEIIDEKTMIRTFDSSKIEEHQLKWHWDKQTRVIEVLNENDWKIQFDNKVPQKLDPSFSYEIKEGVYHRVIKGTGILKLKINKIL